MAWSDYIPPPAHIPLADLLCIDYKKLVEGDAVEIARLFAARKDIGFFYLDIQSQPIWQYVDMQFAIASELFALDDEVKLAHPLKLHQGANLFTTW
jgi:isopenicillin N synthase-like dioxygenase